MKTEKQYMTAGKGSNWSWKRLAFPTVAAVFLLAAATTQASSSTGIDVNGTDIVDSGTTIWDTSNSHIPSTAIVDNLDVNEGNVSNVYSISGSAESMTEVNGETINIKSPIFLDPAGGNGPYNIVFSRTGWMIDAGENSIEDRSSSAEINFDEAGSMEFFSKGKINLTADIDGSHQTCYLDQNDGSWNCDGTKNWIHKINSTHNAVYSGQESGNVRAVYEGQTTVIDGKVKVSLPSHFSKTVSDTEPMLRAVATPHQLANVAVTERTDDYLIIEASKEVKVDYRVTGIREGYEDKQVVRPKQEE